MRIDSLAVTIAALASYHSVTAVPTKNGSAGTAAGPSDPKSPIDGVRRRIELVALSLVQELAQGGREWQENLEQVERLFREAKAQSPPHDGVASDTGNNPSPQPVGGASTQTSSVGRDTGGQVTSRTTKGRPRTPFRVSPWRALETMVAPLDIMRLTLERVAQEPMTPKEKEAKLPDFVTEMGKDLLRIHLALTEKLLESGEQAGPSFMKELFEGRRAVHKLSTSHLESSMPALTMAATKQDRLAGALDLIGQAVQVLHCGTWMENASMVYGADPLQRYHGQTDVSQGAPGCWLRHCFG